MKTEGGCDGSHPWPCRVPQRDGLATINENRKSPYPIDAGLQGLGIREALNKSPKNMRDVLKAWPSAAEAACLAGPSGTAEAVPYPKPSMGYSNPENALSCYIGRKLTEFRQLGQNP
jgi:hypothetical protein